MLVETISGVTKAISRALSSTSHHTPAKFAAVPIGMTVSSELCARNTCGITACSASPASRMMVSNIADPSRAGLSSGLVVDQQRRKRCAGIVGWIAAPVAPYDADEDDADSEFCSDCRNCCRTSAEPALLVLSVACELSADDPPPWPPRWP